MKTYVLRVAAATCAALSIALAGCSGGGGGSSSSSNTEESIQGVATPSTLSVVTAQNDSAGG